MYLPAQRCLLAALLTSTLLLQLAAAPPKKVDKPVNAGLSAWQELGNAEATGSWRVVGSVALDPEDETRLVAKQGKGILVNHRDGKDRNILTRKEYGDVDLHVEFLVSRNSNSGVYLMGRYEVQILDSWDAEGDKPRENPKHGDCGGIYQRWDPKRGKGNEGFEGHAPRVNACRKPGEWQTFDITFKAPRFDADGKLISHAKFVKVVHNGTVVHENVEVKGPTRAASFPDPSKQKPVGPLMLQGDHGPVAYRNIRIRPLNPGR